MAYTIDFMNKKAARSTLNLLGEIEKYVSFFRSHQVNLSKALSSIKSRISAGEDSESVMAEVFALVKIASEESIGLSHYNVQMITSSVVSHGSFVEMKTGEGKTLAITPAAVFKAITGQGVHIFTSNDYLAKANYEELKPLYESLGLSVGLITAGMSKEEKRDAYDSDIVYGSREMIFDVLRDNTTLNGEDLVFKKASFAIVDEADDLFIDSARMPYIISGSLDEDDDSILSDLNSRYKKANNFVYHEIYKKSLDSGKVIRSFKTRDEYEKVNLEKSFDYGFDTYAITIENTKEVILTEAGWLKAYEFYNRNAINEMTNNHKNEIISSGRFTKEFDYTITEEGFVKFTTKGLKKAVEYFDDFKEHNDNFYKNSDSFGNQHYIENALKAYFIINKGIDYELIPDEDMLRVCLVVGGRTDFNKLFSEGVQQALELKEITKMKAKGKKPKIITTVESNDVASTSTIAFFQTMYDDYSGLTGTAPEESFYNLYGKDTVKVEKNVVFEDLKHSDRIDNPTIVYKSENAKINAIIQDVRVRHAKGQPILIGTTSVEESEKIARRLRQEGFELNVLNAKVTELDKEAKIVAQAGVYGAITVATNMAGRGTDIKLGGEFETEKRRLVNSLKKSYFKKWDDEGIPSVEFENRFNLQLQDPVFIQMVLEKTQELLDKKRKEVIETGGLYVIGASLNQTKRVDDQLRGRAARQGDPGESKFYTSLDEVGSIGVHKDDIAKLKEAVSKKGYATGDLVTDIIDKAQSINESNISAVIKDNQEFDVQVAKFADSVYSQRRRILELKEDLGDSILFIIDKTVEDTIGYNIPEYKSVTGKTKIKKSKLEYEKLSEDISSNFGIEMAPEFIEENFATLKDLAVFLRNKVKANYIESCRGKSQDEIQKQNQRFLLDTLDTTWLEFRELVKVTRDQQVLDAFVSNDSYDRVHELKQNYNKSIRQARMEVMQKTFGMKKTVIETLESRESLVPEVDMADVDNSYHTSNKRVYINSISKALDTLLKPLHNSRKKLKVNRKKMGGYVRPNYDSYPSRTRVRVA